MGNQCSEDLLSVQLVAGGGLAQAGLAGEQHSELSSQSHLGATYKDVQHQLLVARAQ